MRNHSIHMSLEQNYYRYEGIEQILADFCGQSS